MSQSCPNCKRKFEDTSAFCEECGVELVCANISDGKAENANVASVDYNSIVGMIKKSSGSSDKSWDLASRSRNIAESLGQSQVSGDSGNPHIKVEYRENIFFLAGMQVPFELRITILNDDVKRVLGWFSPRIIGKENLCYDIPIDMQSRCGRSINLTIPYLPADTVSGFIPFNFYFACVMENETLFYQMSTRHQVYPKGSSSDAVVNQITINASEAGNINANFKELLNTQRLNTPMDLLDRLNNQPSEFKIKKLEESLWRPENSVAAGNCYICDRLTLKIGSNLYHIIGKDVVKFGRKAELNDIVVADTLKGYDPHAYPNNTVSRCHAQIHYCGDTVNLFDNSSYGTFINGVKPTAAGVPIQSEAMIEFGDIHWNMEMQYCSQIQDCMHCKVCPGKKIKSISFSRCDAVPENYLLVWECCELGYIDKRFAGFTIIRRNGGFILKSADWNYYYLFPGFKLSHKDAELSVNNFKQYGI